MMFRNRAQDCRKFPLVLIAGLALRVAATVKLWLSRSEGISGDVIEQVSEQRSQLPRSLENVTVSALLLEKTVRMVFLVRHVLPVHPVRMVQRVMLAWSVLMAIPRIGNSADVKAATKANVVGYRLKGTSAKSSLGQAYEIAKELRKINPALNVTVGTSKATLKECKPVKYQCVAVLLTK